MKRRVSIVAVTDIMLVIAEKHARFRILPGPLTEVPGEVIPKVVEALEVLRTLEALTRDGTHDIIVVFDPKGDLLTEELPGDTPEVIPKEVHRPIVREVAILALLRRKIPEGIHPVVIKTDRRPLNSARMIGTGSYDDKSRVVASVVAHPPTGLMIAHVGVGPPLKGERVPLFATRHIPS